MFILNACENALCYVNNFAACVACSNMSRSNEVVCILKLMLCEDLEVQGVFCFSSFFFS